MWKPWNYSPTGFQRVLVSLFFLLGHYFFWQCMAVLYFSYLSHLRTCFVEEYEGAITNSTILSNVVEWATGWLTGNKGGKKKHPWCTGFQFILRDSDSPTESTGCLWERQASSALGVIQSFEKYNAMLLGTCKGVEMWALVEVCMELLGRTHGCYLSIVMEFVVIFLLKMENTLEMHQYQDKSKTAEVYPDVSSIQGFETELHLNSHHPPECWK